MPSTTRKKTKMQLNFEVPPAKAKLVKQDARRFNKALASVGQAALDYFYSMRVEDRERFLSRYPNKVMGRKVAA